jgi:hypothetical protein
MRIRGRELRNDRSRVPFWFSVVLMESDDGRLDSVVFLEGLKMDLVCRNIGEAIVINLYLWNYLHFQIPPSRECFRFPSDRAATTIFR